MMQKLGWALSGLFGLFMLGASVAPKLSGMAVADESLVALGWENAPLLLIGVLELIATVLYLIPATGVLGAALMMAILGGAMATNLQGQAPLYSHTLFSVYLGILMWVGLILRDPRIRAVFPLVR
ncbi:DoxX family protein [Stagnihabitans tardus]|uniref:DoxX family protein n=1 Tax=Stagnihabitans tardus TaxID=2699202 RepID=A0AAE5BV16_9RHOB|nr:DoxX family protein [Stagnihabitans tardus]NBZ88461.1 DoxX family protein [Stagnihabitans tardus]